MSMELSKHYAIVYENEYNGLTKWKQHAINEDLSRKKLTGITEDFIKSVISKAEDLFDRQKQSEKVS